MPLAWNEIRHRAIKFANEWSHAAREAAEKQTYWNEFFDVFGVSRKAVASFEAPVKKLTGHDGFIDLFWKGNLIVEHKSLGGDLGKAQSQAFEYIQALFNEGKHNEIPRYVIVSDFARIVLYDLEPDEQKHLPLFADHRVQVAADFPLAELHKNIRPFAFIAGYRQQRLDPEDPANLQAARIMADLHDALKAGNYTGHELRVFLVRILFCLFAEDTGIFGQPRQFELYLTNHTAVDGSDLGPKLARLFSVLNTPEADRQKHLEADLTEFPYVNGDLFKEALNFADFNSDMRNALLGASRFRWETISPAVFGSLFQEVMQAPERRQIGAHYTAEKNIMKVVRSLFLDDLLAELAAIKTDKSTRRDARLDEFHKKLANLRFLDPACGCGNFLVITYRELRALELEVLKLKHGTQRHFTLGEISKLSLLDVDQMYGIEIEEFPARIAEVALWLVDHQANMALSIAFSEKFIRIPLRKSPHIHVGNALRMDWAEVIARDQCSYILGNPPFVGKSFQSSEQKADMDEVFHRFESDGVLDYVCAWYVKAAEYIKGTRITVGYVSTNSITQGEQVCVLWRVLFSMFGVKIHFAHRTFSWESEARGRAHVHVVIIGFAEFDRPDKRLYEYENTSAEPVVGIVQNINPYLVAGGDLWIDKRRSPLCDAQPMVYGSKPVDGGHLILEAEDRQRLLADFPEAKPFVRPFLGSVELINGIDRWCLWLADADPAEWRRIAGIHDRVDGVRAFRAKSKKRKTVEQAEQPFAFGELRQPRSDYLAVPEVSSENRRYIPIGFVNKRVIASNLLYTVAKATHYTFGILTSQIHVAWVRYVCGRLKSDFRYSSGIVYNNFPWPEAPNDTQKAKVEEAAQAVLNARKKFPDATLADLYDPVSMPAELTKAHHALDRAVERCYRKEPFPNDRARVEFLFALYEKLTAPLLPPVKAKPPGGGRRKGNTNRRKAALVIISVDQRELAFPPSFFCPFHFTVVPPARHSPSVKLLPPLPSAFDRQRANRRRFRCSNNWRNKMERTLDKEFSTVGQFWLPGDPNNRVTGTLTYSKSKIELALAGGLSGHPFGTSGNQQEFPSIYGVTHEGPCTLLRAYECSNEISSDGISREVLGAIYLVDGSHTTTVDDLRLRSMSLGFSYLNPFLAMRPFEMSITGHDMSITCRHPEPLSYRIEPIETTLRFGIRTRRGGGVLSPGFNSTSIAVLKPDQPKSIEWFLEKTRRLCDLLSLLSDEPTLPTCMQAKLGDVEPSEASLLYCDSSPRQAEEVNSYQLLFSFPKVKDSFGTILDRWYSADQRLVNSTYLFRAARWGPGELDDRFLAATKCLEAFSRSRGDSEYMSSDDYHEVAKKLYDAIAGVVDADLRRSLEKRIQFGNEHSFRKRIKSLVRSLSAESQALVCKNPENFITGIVNTRNHLTHYSDDPDTIPLDGIDRFWACEKLLILMRLALLKYVGLEETTVVAAMGRHWRRLQQYIDNWKESKEMA